MLPKRAFGIDISYAQATFAPPERNDLDFVILKASQANFPDPKFGSYYPPALRIPIRGAYHYFITSRVTTTEMKPVGAKKNKQGGQTTAETVEIAGFTWHEQAEVFLKQVKDKDIHFFALDLEIIGGTDPRTGKRITNQYSRTDVQNIRRWVDEVKKRTARPVLLYTRANVFRNYVQPNGGEILKDLDLWIARYPTDSSKGAGGNPYEGDDSVKIPGVSSWRLWQYSDRNNGRGAQYGAKTKSVDLDVYNGTVDELRAWLGIGALEPVVITGDEKKQVVEEPAPVGPRPGSGGAAIREQLEVFTQAGITPVVHLNINLDLTDINTFEAILGKLKEAGITPEVHFTFQAGPGPTKPPGAGGGGSGSTVEVKPTGEPGKPPLPAPEEGGSFTVVVTPDQGERTALQGFAKTDKAGKPIMAPIDSVDTGKRITKNKGDRLRVSATHKVSRLDIGDGKIRGADGRFYYYITDDPANEDAAGLYVLEPDVRRV